jgi:hypothetical protein
VGWGYDALTLLRSNINPVTNPTVSDQSEAVVVIQ